MGCIPLQNPTTLSSGLVQCAQGGSDLAQPVQDAPSQFKAESGLLQQEDVHWLQSMCAFGAAAAMLVMHMRQDTGHISCQPDRYLKGCMA